MKIKVTEVNEEDFKIEHHKGCNPYISGEPCEVCDKPIPASGWYEVVPSRLYDIWKCTYSVCSKECAKKFVHDTIKITNGKEFSDMGYPFDKTYLEQIQNSKYERDHIREAFWVLRKKYLNDHPDKSDVGLTLPEEFAILGEAFDLESGVLDIPDQYHFMWDVLDALLPEKSEE